MKKGLISAGEALQRFRKGEAVDYRHHLHGQESEWKPDPFVKVGTDGDALRAEAFVGAGRIEFRVRPKEPRVHQIVAEVFGSNRPGSASGFAGNVSDRSVREALKAVVDRFSAESRKGLVGGSPNQLQQIVNAIEEEFCGPEEVLPSAEQTGDFPPLKIGQVWQAQKMLPGKKWVDVEPKDNGLVVIHNLGLSEVLRFSSGYTVVYNSIRFRPTGEVHDKIRYRYRCVDRNEARK